MFAIESPMGLVLLSFCRTHFSVYSIPDCVRRTGFSLGAWHKDDLLDVEPFCSSVMKLVIPEGTTEKWGDRKTQSRQWSLARGGSAIRRVFDRRELMAGQRCCVSPRHLSA